MSGSGRARVYRNIERRQEWLGLEPFDALALGALLWLLMLVNRHGLGWNFVILAASFASLRILKRGKPEGYTGALLRFHFGRKPFLSAQARDREALAHPFSPTEPRTRPKNQGDRP